MNDELEKLAAEIEALPDDAEFYLCRQVPAIGRTVQGYGNDGMVTHLKDLVASWREREERGKTLDELKDLAKSMKEEL